jgi:predicted enzyme related to lactoylglutathione lyase
MKIKRINCVFIYCRDLAKMRAFYEQALELGKPVVNAKWWVEYAMGEGTHFALHQGKPEHFEGANPGRTTIKFSVEVTDIKAVAEKLKVLGARFHFEPRSEYGFWLSEFEDMEGNVLRLYEKTRTPKNA